MKAREKLKALLRFCIFEAHKDNSRLIVIGYSELTNRITQFRPLLADSGGQSYEFFGEFLREHEFDLALHVVCDFLIESPTVRVSAPVLNEIRDLHEMMNLQDQCVCDLEKKLQDGRSGQSGS